MKIITAADGKYKEMVIASMAMNARQGYQTIVYDLGGLGFGIPWDVTADMEMIRKQDTPYTGTNMMKAPFKPRIILDALINNPNEDRLAWIDADAYCIDQIHMIMYRKVWDIAVTMRRANENKHSIYPMFDGYINSGVMLLRNNACTRGFIQRWIDALPTAPTLVDQEALNMVLGAPDLTECNRIYDVGNVKVMVLSTDEYNFYYFPDEPHEYTKVLHFKGMKDQMQMKYFNHYLKLNLA